MEQQLTVAERARVMSYVDEYGLGDLKIDLDKHTTLSALKKHISQRQKHEVSILLLFMLPFFGLLVFKNGWELYLLSGVLMVSLYAISIVKKRRKLLVEMFLVKLDHVYKYSKII